VSFNSGPGTSWSELESKLAGRPDAPATDGDSPTSRRKRDGYLPPTDLRHRQMPDDPADVRVPYAELHAHSNFSFLDGASHPEELIEEAARLGLDAIALTDHDGMYGVVRFAEAGRQLGVRTVFGAELSLGLTARQTGVADPEGSHLLVLARNPTGYGRLCRVISSAHLRGEEKGKPVYDFDEVIGELAGHVVVLTGCRKGPAHQMLAAGGPDAARGVLQRLTGWFGHDNVAVELTDTGLPQDSTINDVLAGLAGDLALPTVASGNVHYHHPDRSQVAAAMAAIRARRSLEEMDGWRNPAGQAFLHSGAEMAAIMRRYPGAVQRAALLGVQCAFDLDLIAPDLPPYPVPAGHTEITWLRHLTMAGAAERYGPPERHTKAYRQLEHELAIIETLNFPGYFLIVDGLVRFCRENGILCQGRGSAANSAVCYALGITNADPIEWDLLFERFLSIERDGPPDIDLDIEAGRREEVIQHVYANHGRRHAALVANVITYRAKSAVQDAGRALGYSPGQVDTWGKSLDSWSGLTDATNRTTGGQIPGDVLALAGALEGFPRHLGIHPGGMVICDRPVSEVCPVEHATMANRTVLQWEKDDCASAGLVKFDLLGLGMLSAIHGALDLINEHHGVDVDIAHLDLADKAVYEMLCRADSVGLFQVESRAQMSTLPRLKPRTFWDIAVEVALIRPGPIQGGAVHPYLRRRQGEPWTHDHPLLERALDRTLGVVLFQEQVMQVAQDVAGFSAGEADALRRAMGSKRSARKMEQLRQRFYDGAAERGITGPLADKLFIQVKAFSGYGFPMSHALSFAHIVFVSAWLRLYYPAAFTAALLGAQPMGFYSPQSLVADVRRRGIGIRRAEVNRSRAQANLEADPDSTGGQAIRLGLATVRLIGDNLAQRIVEDRERAGPYASIPDLARRVGLTAPQLESLATAGALAEFDSSRRRALWTAGAAARERPSMLPGTTGATTPPPTLPGMTAFEILAADYASTGVTPGQHPVEHLRQQLTQRGIVPAHHLVDIEDGTRVHTAGVVTHRQRPGTAGGITFLSLEDETGLANIVVSKGMAARYRDLVHRGQALIVRGIVENASGATNLVADKLEPLPLGITTTSRDFR
jgi:error-prone DNA polymerase